MKKRLGIPYFMAGGEYRICKPELGEDKGTCGEWEAVGSQHHKLTSEEVSNTVERFTSIIKNVQVESSRGHTWFRILNTLEKKKRE